jgi:hypothetical protein
LVSQVFDPKEGQIGRRPGGASNFLRKQQFTADAPYVRVLGREAKSRSQVLGREHIVVVNEKDKLTVCLLNPPQPRTSHTWYRLKNKTGGNTGRD